jgi:UDPglucose 6-dehydrogenase
MNNAVIIGHGVIGKATANAFVIGNHIDLEDSNITYEEAAKQKYIFICLPTPTINGKCFTSDIHEVIKNLIKSGLSEDSVIIIRSTVTPGFSRSIQKSLGITNIVSNPEFLSEDTAEYDMQNPDIIVIGSDSPRHLEMVKGLYMGRFKYAEIVETDSVTAEFIKYALNVFFATKVVFANQIFDGTQKLGANYETVRKVLEMHKWGSKNHFRVTHKGGRGAGGRCLHKDLEAFAGLVTPSIFDKIKSINDTYLEMTKKV